MLIFFFLFIVSFVFSLWLVFYFSRGRFSFFMLFLVILLSLQYFFILLFSFRSYVYFGPEASLDLTKTLLEQSLSPSDLEEVVKSPSTSSWSSRLYLAYLLVFFSVSFFFGGGALFYYHFVPAYPVLDVVSPYPVVEAAYARGPLLLLPESSYTVSHIVNMGPVPMLEWPYISPYVPVDLSLGVISFKELLGILPCLYMEDMHVMAAFGSDLIVRGQSGAALLQSMVKVSMASPSGVQNIFIPEMFVDIPVELFSSLLSILSHEELVHMSGIFPSLHPLCLAESISAETFHELSLISISFSEDSLSTSFSDSTSSLGSLPTSLVPAELVPSPWHW